MNHLLTMSQLTAFQMEQLINDAQFFSNGGVWKPIGFTPVANLFFEPSTRTKSSFEMAERRLGLEVIPFEAGTSSVLKGESLYDTVKTFESIGVEALVIRHAQDRFYKELTSRSGVSIINAGDGCGQHPTQSLLDLMTIKQEFGRFTGLKVAIIGDIKHSRVARSNAEALNRLGAEVVFSGPREWMDTKFAAGKYEEIETAVETADVVMLLRIQQERHANPQLRSKEAYHEAFGLTREREKRMKPRAIIMHPAPINRGVEIDPELPECSRSRIFKQMENGVYIRMAVLKAVIEQKEGGARNESNHQKWSMA